MAAFKIGSNVMSKIIFAIALMLVGIAHAQNQPDPFAQMLGDKNMWQAMDWSSFEASKVWTASGWNEYISKEATRTFIKSRTVRLFDIDFTSNLSRRNDAVKTPWNLAVAALGSCDKAMSWATTRFGSPTASFDGSHEGIFSDDTPITVTRVQRASQWDIGQTRIVVECDGIHFPIKSPDDILVILLSFSHKSEQELIKPMFMLSCSRKITHWDGESTDVHPLTFYVDEHWKMVRSPQKRPFAGDDDRKEFSITPETISFVIKVNDMITKYSIDRLTGSMSGTATIGEYASRISGMCEKIEPTSKKF